MKLVKGSPEAKAYMAKLRAMAAKRRGIRAGSDMPSTSKGQKPLDFSGKHVYGVKRRTPNRLDGNRAALALRVIRSLAIKPGAAGYLGAVYRALQKHNFTMAEADEALRYAKAWPRENPARRSASEKALDKQIEAAYYRVARGVQVGIMDVPKIFADAKALLAAGRTDIDQVLIEVVKKYQFAGGGGRLLNNPKGKSKYASYCQNCCWRTKPQMMTGYCLSGQKCDRCGRVSDLAMVDTSKKNPHASVVFSTPAKLEAEKIAGWMSREGVVVQVVPTARGEWGVKVPPNRFAEARHAFGRVISRNPQFKARFIASDGVEIETKTVRAHGVRSAMKKAERMTLDMPARFRGARSEIEITRCNPKTCRNNSHGRRNPTDVTGKYFEPGFVIWFTEGQAEAYNALRILKENGIEANMEAAPSDSKKFGKWTYKIHVTPPTDSVSRMILEGVLNRISKESIYGQMTGHWESIPRPRSIRPRAARRNPYSILKRFKKGSSGKAAAQKYLDENFQTLSVKYYDLCVAPVPGEGVWAIMAHINREYLKNPLLQMVTLANPMRPRASRSVPFDVYLDGKKIDTVFAGPKSDAVAEEVRRSLIEHDGYDPRIVVRLRGGQHPARHNPAAPSKPPFRHGQIITVAQALDYARRSGNASLVRQCEEAIKLCKKANGPAQKVRFDLVAMGDPKKIDAVMAGVEYGQTDETMYKPTKGSKKGQHLYRHDWGEGTGKRRPVPLIATPGGKALVMPLGSKQKATDWLRG